MFSRARPSTRSVQGRDSKTFERFSKEQKVKEKVFRSQNAPEDEGVTIKQNLTINRFF